MFSIFGLMILMAAILGTGTVVGFGGWLVNRIRRIESRNNDPELLEKLFEQVEHLRDQGEVTREEIAELQERVDFAERLLTKGENVAAEDR